MVLVQKSRETKAYATKENSANSEFDPNGLSDDRRQDLRLS